MFFRASTRLECHPITVAYTYPNGTLLPGKARRQARGVATSSCPRLVNLVKSSGVRMVDEVKYAPEGADPFSTFRRVVGELRDPRG